MSLYLMSLISLASFIKLDLSKLSGFKALLSNKLVKY